LPFALALLPVIGLGIFASTAFETGFVLFATALAIASLWHGYRGHRAYHAFAVLVPGLVALWDRHPGARAAPAALPHAVAMSIGGTLVAIAHLVNLRLSRGHTHDDAHGTAMRTVLSTHPPQRRQSPCTRHAGHGGEARIPPPADAA
jgi:hypothetical protein